MKQARISRGGQVSIPADVRHRWKTDRIMIEDRGDQVIVRPLPDDPIAAARGSLKPFAAEDAITSDEARARTRAEEAASGPGAIRLTVFDAQALIAFRRVRAPRRLSSRQSTREER